MKDEQEATDDFERLVGGPERGFALMRLHRDCANPISMPGRPKPTQTQVFKTRAFAEGYSVAAINAFLAL